MAKERGETLSALVVGILAFYGTVIQSALEDGDQYPMPCKNTIQGRHLLADDRGYVCGVLSINPFSGCCPESSEQFSCYGCDVNLQCCDSYEYCVSCCLNPSRTIQELAIKMKVARQATAGTYDSLFNFCTGRCRHNSANVVHENAYASEMHHCFSLQPNSSGLVKPHSEVELSDVSIVVGRQGLSCTSVCQSGGQSCILSRLLELNNCGVLQKYMSCKGACIVSRGSDQPAEVVNDAPRHMHPGGCLFNKKQSVLSCDGSHEYTRRLCTCA
uniref:SREBP regulating gene protein n=1 Tax=Araucaria cunninghamii TaxID=56994 RepID=A0A0D6R8H5_ARACU